MNARFSNNLALGLLVVVAFVAVQIGGSLGRGLTILAVLAWIVAIILIVYLVLFRDVSFKPSWLSKKPEDQQTVFIDEDESVDSDDFEVDGRIESSQLPSVGERSAN